MSVTVVCPGSFDPVTNGHLDVIARAAARFDRVVVAILENPAKQPLFDVDERIALLTEAIAHHDNVSVDRFQGLLVSFCQDRGIGVIIKGLRAVSDFEYELQMAQMNRELGDIETIFIPTNPAYSYLASSLVKDVARWGGDYTRFVPPNVAAALSARGRARDAARAD